MPSTRRLFTPAEATRMLPLVRRIVEDILAAGRAMRAHAVQPRPDPEQVRLYDRELEQLRSLIRELEELGCSFKDWRFDVGLVDFPARIDGEDVLLCWRSDEPAIRFYHALEDGYAGRKPIPPHLLSSQREPHKQGENHAIR